MSEAAERRVGGGGRAPGQIGKELGAGLWGLLGENSPTREGQGWPPEEGGAG